MFKPKFVLLIALATSTLVASYLYFTRNTTSLEPTESKLAVPIATGKNISQNSADSEKNKLISKLKSINSVSIITSSDNEIIKNFIVSLDAAAAMDIIDKAYTDGNDSLAHKLEAQLYGRCAGLPYMSADYEDDPNTKPFMEIESAYCASYTEVISHEEFSSRTSVLYKESELENLQLKTKIKNLNLSDQASAIVHQIVNSKTRSSLDLTNALLHQLHQTKPEISFTKLEYPYFPRVAFDSYFSAIDLYGCFKFGGCESGQYIANWHCINAAGLCRPGWSVYDYYGNNLSSNQLENVILILEFLLSQQPTP